MQLPNWFKVCWWLFLIAILTNFLYLRYPQLVVGNAAAVDIFVFAVWMALLLAPLFNEVSLLGVSLKQHVEELKSFVTKQVSEIRSEVRNAVDVSASVNPQFHIGLPPPDSQLPQIEERIRSIVSDQLAARGIQSQAVDLKQDVSQDVIFLFSVRLNLEREIRRIAENRGLVDPSRRFEPAVRLIQILVQEEIIDSQMMHAVREVYSVCSPAIHGETVTDAQVNFVRDVGPELISTLRMVS